MTDYNHAILNKLDPSNSSKSDRMQIVEENRRRVQAEMIATGKIQVPGQIRPGDLTSAAIAATTPSLRDQPIKKQLNPEGRPAQMVSDFSLEQLQNEIFRRKEDLEKQISSMVLDANTYRVNLPTIRLLTEDKSIAERIKFSGCIAAVTGVPIAIVLGYIGELYGFTKELEQRIGEILTFYTVSEILNLKRPKKEELSK